MVLFNNITRRGGVLPILKRYCARFLAWFPGAPCAGREFPGRVGGAQEAEVWPRGPGRGHRPRLLFLGLAWGPSWKKAEKAIGSLQYYTGTPSVLQTSPSGSLPRGKRSFLTPQYNKTANGSFMKDIQASMQQPGTHLFFSVFFRRARLPHIS